MAIFRIRPEYLALNACLFAGCNNSGDDDGDSGEPADSTPEVPATELTCTPDPLNAVRAHCTVVLGEAGPAAVTLEAGDRGVDI